jgi:tripartite-type tricarboxylate transporter receptor subunit TctC
LELTRVSYRELAPALQDLAESRIQLYASALATQLPLVRSGKIRVLAVTNQERASLLPEVPTAREAGFDALTFDAFLGFFGARGLSPELRDRVSADIRAVGADPTLRSRLSEVGLIVRTNTPTELAGVVEKERQKILSSAPAAGSKSQ